MRAGPRKDGRKSRELGFWDRSRRAILRVHDQPPPGPAALHAVPVSALLTRIAQDWPRDHLTLAELASALGQRGFGVLIVLFALPNLVPFYLPGLSTVAGVPMLILCAQLALGLPTPRLPGFIARRTISRARLRVLVLKALPWLLRVERMVRPRPSRLTSPLGERAIGAYGILLSAIVILPTPLTNGPPALACLIMAMGMTENDSVTISAGAALGVGAAVVSLTILYSFGWALLAGFNQLIGSP